MTFTVDRSVVRQHRLALLAEGVEVAGRSSLDPPRAGAMSKESELALRLVGDRADRLAAGLRELADALDRWAELAATSDDAAASTLDLVMAAVLSS